MGIRKAAACTLSAALALGSVSAQINPEISSRQPAQQNGQLQGQLNWIRKTLEEGGTQRVYQGDTLKNVNFPLAGMGTGLVYFNGNLIPYKWDIGNMKLESFMAENTLFSVITETEGQRDGVVLRGENALNDRNAFSDMPAKGGSNGGGTKRGAFFINTSLFAPNYNSYNDTRTGELLSRKLRLPASAKELAALVGGGRNSGKNKGLLYLGIVDAATGDVYASLSGDDQEDMRNKRVAIPQEAYGRDVYVTIVDKSANDWGHINVDDIRFEDGAGQRVEVEGFDNGSFEKQLEGWTIAGSGADTQGLPVCGVDQVKAVIEYPFGFYDFSPDLPVDIQLQMFNPMIPLNERDSSIPTGMFQIVLTNTTDKEVNASVLSTLANGMYGNRSNRVVSDENGTYLLLSNDIHDGEIGDGVLALWSPSKDAGYSAGQPDVKALYDQAMAGGLDGKSTAEGQDAVGGLLDRVTLSPGETKTVRFAYAWHFPNFFADNLWGNSHTNIGRWYDSFYADVQAVIADIAARFDTLYAETLAYHDSLYDTTLPYYFADAAACTMDVLRSPTFYIAKDGTPYGWEGSDGKFGTGYCPGNCQHVWNYAEGFYNLFPVLAGKWKAQDFTVQQNPSGLLFNRLGNVPANKTGEDPAIDGTLGSIMLAWRLHQNMPDNAWLKELWPHIRKCMDAAVNSWDLNEDGLNERSANMTYDKWMSGTTVRINAMYLGALKACESMAKVMGDQESAAKYALIYEKGPKALDALTWNGEYYEQVGSVKDSQHEGTIGAGLLTDTLLGQTHMYLYGLGEVLDPLHMRSQVNAAFKYNFFYPVGARYKPEYNSADRIYALPDDPATLVCTWPKGGDGTMLYASEDWSGTSYTNAVNMIYMGNIQKALATVWSVRSRYDGKDMDPLNERELGSYYARSMSAYGLIEAASGIEKNGPEAMLGFNPNITPEDFRGFFNTATSWGSTAQSRTVSGGTFTQTNAVEVNYGTLPLGTYRLYLPQEIYPTLNGLQVTVTVDGQEVEAQASAIQAGGLITVSFAQPLTVKKGSRVEFTVTGQTGSAFSFTDEFLYGDLRGWTTEQGLAFINDTGLQVVLEDGETVLSRKYLKAGDHELTAKVRLTDNASFGWDFQGRQVVLRGDGTCEIRSGETVAASGTAALTGETEALLIRVKGDTVAVSLNDKVIAEAKVPAGESAGDAAGIRGNCAMRLSGDLAVDTLQVSANGSDVHIHNNQYAGGANPPAKTGMDPLTALLWGVTGAFALLLLIGGGIAFHSISKKRRGANPQPAVSVPEDGSNTTGNETGNPES